MHDRHGLEVAGPLCREAACGSRRDGRSGRRAEVYGGDEQTHPGVVGSSAAPKRYARWTGPLLATALGDVDVQHIWRFLRAQKIDLAGRKPWCESNDPEFVAKAADVVGLYMAPPENAIVICVDEKPPIQALVPGGTRPRPRRIDEPGEQPPGKALQRRKTLPDDRKTAIRQRCDDEDIILLADRMGISQFVPGTNSTSRSIIAIHGDRAWCGGL
jgi:hypothetical protein